MQPMVVRGCVGLVFFVITGCREPVTEDLKQASDAERASAVFAPYIHEAPADIDGHCYYTRWAELKACEPMRTHFAQTLAPLFAAQGTMRVRAADLDLWKASKVHVLPSFMQWEILGVKAAPIKQTLSVVARSDDTLFYRFAYYLNMNACAHMKDYPSALTVASYKNDFKLHQAFEDELADALRTRCDSLFSAGQPYHCHAVTDTPSDHEP